MRCWLKKIKAQRVTGYFPFKAQKNEFLGIFSAVAGVFIVRVTIIFIVNFQCNPNRALWLRPAGAEHAHRFTRAATS